MMMKKDGTYTFKKPKIDWSFIYNLEYFLGGMVIGLVAGLLLGWTLWSTAGAAELQDETPEAAAVAYEADREEAIITEAIAALYPRISQTEIEKTVRAATIAGTLYRIPRELILAVIATESAFNRQAVSRVGAQGLMQVFAKYHPGLVEGGDLHEIDFGVAVGTLILRDCLDRKPDLYEALACYNGAVTPWKKKVYYRDVERNGNRIRAQILAMGEAEHFNDVAMNDGH